METTVTRRKCLLVIDVQVGFFTLPRPLLGGTHLIETVRELLRRARSAGVAIIYAQHSAPEGGPLGKGSDGWAFHPAVAPWPGDHVVEKTHCDAFEAGRLESLLTSLGVEHIVVCGLATEGCVDTTVRRAFGLGFKVEVASDGHSTTDSSVLTAEQIIRHHNEVFKAFADVREAGDITFTA